MPRNILSELSRPNPVVDNSATIGSTRRALNNWQDAISECSEWTDFNPRVLYEMYKPYLMAEWRDIRQYPDPTYWDSQLCDEKTLESNILCKYTTSPVNDALEFVFDLRRQLQEPAKQVNLGIGDRCRLQGLDAIIPDWALCSREEMDQFGPKSADENIRCYVPLLVGDTKLAQSWSSSSGTPESKIVGIQQIMHYCKLTRCRYGFILTEEEVVVFRCTREEIGDGLANSRSRRTRAGSPLAAGRVRAASDATDVSMMSLAESVEALSLQQHSSESGSFQPSERDTDLAAIEYQAIPWKSNGDGKNQLTVRLALFYLCMMATYGPREIDTSYPTFDSWTLQNNKYIHNTTGLSVGEKPSRGILHHRPDGMGNKPEWVSDVDGEGQRFLTRLSVEALDSDLASRRYFYEDEEHGRVYVTENYCVYDTDTGSWGYFKEREWMAIEKKGEPR
ncbi:hypothetical protein RB601_003924 [Gaeumannomyces tritici]